MAAEDQDETQRRGRDGADALAAGEQELRECRILERSPEAATGPPGHETRKERHEGDEHAVIRHPVGGDVRLRNCRSSAAQREGPGRSTRAFVCSLIFFGHETRDYAPAAFTMSKIGRYIATTMPPTTTPRNTIITGSISARRPDTAASTSSS